MNERLFRHFLLCSTCMACLLTASCDNNSDNPVDCSGLAPTYTTDIKPILDSSCALSGCHDAATSQKGVNLSMYSTASSISQEARFLGVIEHRAGFTPMPFGGNKLPDHHIRLLQCWVENGSPQ